MKKPEETLQEFRDTLEAIPDKEERVNRILEFVNIYADSHGAKIISVLDEGIRVAKETGYEAAEIICYYKLLFSTVMTEGKVNSQYISNVPPVAEMLEKLRLNYPEWYSYGLCMHAYLHWFRGEYEKGFNAMFEAIRFVEHSPLIGGGWVNFGLGVFYFDTKDFENSAIYYKNALNIFSKANHEYGVARASNGLASIAILQNRIPEAVPLLDFSAGVYRKFGHYSGLSRVLNDKGLLEKAAGRLSEAAAYLHESIELRKEINHVQGLITSHTELGEVLLLSGDHGKALEHFETALALANSISARQKQIRLYKLMYETYKGMGNTELALHCFEKHFEIRAEILGDEATNNIKKIQTRYEKEKSEKEAEFERFRNVELQKANAIIEQKNKDITDSINYARRIQLGILPSQELLDKCFQNYFVLYKPKDIVSGDFYWAVESRDRRTGNKISVIAAVDCTGHGVPGAFMSMLGNTLLNQTINDPAVLSAADVLNYLNLRLPENLHSTTPDQNLRDGMDMALCIFNLAEMKMQFAGANNPCWVIRDNELIELKGDKQPISASNDLVKKEFSNKEFDLKKNDRIYLITDGYADQFGGPNEKKFTYRRLKELLMSIHQKPSAEQRTILDENFESWRSNLEQIDDVCVIGITI